MPVTLHPRVWLNLFVPPLRPIERIVLDAWLAKADPETRSIGAEQIARYNLVQRGAGGREVNLYSIKYGLFLAEVPRLLPRVGREAVLGAVTLTVRGQAVVCEVHAANGRLFSLVFEREPTLGVRRNEIVVCDVRPVLPSPTPDRNRSLPDDYDDVVARFGARDDGQEIALLDRKDLHVVHLEEGDFLILAELPDRGMLGVESRRQSGLVYFLSYDGRPPRPLSRSLFEAISLVRLRPTGA
jgi:hypothetical protein